MNIFRVEMVSSFDKGYEKEEGRSLLQASSSTAFPVETRTSSGSCSSECISCPIGRESTSRRGSAHQYSVTESEWPTQQVFMCTSGCLSLFLFTFVCNRASLRWEPETVPVLCGPFAR